jgi:predicted transcriptional regulator
VSKVEFYENIRLARRDEGLSVRTLAVRFRVHRREVRMAINGDAPVARAVWMTPLLATRRGPRGPSGVPHG